jgi:hypothetical protein
LVNRAPGSAFATARRGAVAKRAPLGPAAVGRAVFGRAHIQREHSAIGFFKYTLNIYFLFLIPSLHVLLPEMYPSA